MNSQRPLVDRRARERERFIEEFNGGGQRSADPEAQTETSRRDFLKLATGALAAVGAGASVVPFARSMSPAADIAAQRTAAVDISDIALGDQLLAVWQGKPIFIVQRTEEMIQQARSNVPRRDPQRDEDRVIRPEWLVLIGICTHLGCVPTWKPEETQGWHCACHGSFYDFSGRILRGPAPRNLEVPPYKFETDTEILIGEA